MTKKENVLPQGKLHIWIVLKLYIACKASDNYE